MPVDPELRNLDIDIPAKPDVLVRLSLLLADEDVNLDAVGQLVESDMALAASVMTAVCSSLYVLTGRVQSVQLAVTCVGAREGSCSERNNRASCCSGFSCRARAQACETS